MKMSWVWFGVACGAGFLAYREWQVAQSAQRVAYAAQQAAEQARLQAEAAGTCSPVDSITQMAVMWFQQMAASTTLQDLQGYLSKLQAVYIPLVIQAWQANGLSPDLFLQLAKGLGL